MILSGEFRKIGCGDVTLRHNLLTDRAVRVRSGVGYWDEDDSWRSGKDVVAVRCQDLLRIADHQVLRPSVLGGMSWRGCVLEMPRRSKLRVPDQQCRSVRLVLKPLG